MDREYTEIENTLVAAEILAQIAINPSGATIIGLSGDLGAGKTALVRSIAQLLGVHEAVVSPTFVIAKFYPLETKDFDHLVHVDAYRIDSLAELEPLGWSTLVAKSRTLIIVEWAERLDGALPVGTNRFMISHRDEHRHISNI